LAAFMDGLWDRLPRSAVFGGFVRDFGLGVDARLRSDIDIVSEASSLEIEAALEGHSVIRNKFGGYRLYAGGRLFDIWSLDDTWAARQNLVRLNKLEDLYQTTFFNLDTGLLDYSRGRLLGNACSDDLEAALQRRVLDINLVANPDPTAMARRAVKMAIEKDLCLSPKLAQFVIESRYRDPSSPLFSSFLARLEAHVNGISAHKPYKYCEQMTLWPQ
jgi:hypothetical protein